MAATINRLLRAAQYYATLGWYVHPVVPNEKRVRCFWRLGDANPALLPKPYPSMTDNDWWTTWGNLQSSVDVHTIDAWWTGRPDSSVGVQTGRISGIMILDVDMDETKGIDGEASLSDLETTHGPLPMTAEQETPSGGRQLVFRYPEAWHKVKTTAGLGSKPGVDVRGDGGQAVLPPSQRGDGEYRWIPGREPWHHDLAELPEGWRELLEVQPPAPRPKGQTKVRPGESTHPWCAAMLEAIVDELASVPTSCGRNSRLFWVSRRLHEYERWFEPGVIVPAMIDASRANGLIEDDGEQSVTATIESGARKGRTKSSDPPENGNHNPRQKSPLAQTMDKLSPPHGVNRKKYLVTDVGNSERFSDIDGDNLRFCYSQKSWCRWTGRRWSWDASGEVNRLAENIVREMLSEGVEILSRVAGDDAEEKRVRAIIAHAMASHRISRRNAMVEGARHRLEVMHDVFDCDQWVFNTIGGTVDLQTGSVRPHQRTDYLTKLSSVQYEPNAECPRWLSFLDRAMAGNEPLVDFLQRAIGYSLTGSTREQCLFLLIGPSGNNGKSVFLSTLAHVFGEYGVRSEFKTFLADPKHGGRNKGPDLERLQGARFVCAAEPNASHSLDESLIKDITGGEAIAVNPKYRDPFEFTPQCKLWLGCNTPPKLPRGGKAMWRRLRVIPFDVEIPEPERDDELLAKLQTEAPGIIAWAIKGCLEWQRQKLNPPLGVIAAEQDYQEDNDPLAPWLASCVVDVPGNWESLKAVHASYCAWCAEHGITHPKSKQAIRQMLEERGYRTGKSKIGKIIKDITLVAENETGRVTKCDDFPQESPCAGANKYIKHNIDTEHEYIHTCAGEKSLGKAVTDRHPTTLSEDPEWQEAMESIDEN